MTIVASVKVQDGIVLGADSMTQLWGTDAAGNAGLVKAYDHAQKLFQLGEHVGVTAYGIGNIGPRSIGSFIGELSRGLAQSGRRLVVKEGAERLFSTLREAYTTAFGALPQQQQPSLGILLGGYSTDEPLAEEWEFVLPGSTAPQPVRAREQFGAAWRGVALPFNRLFWGFEPQLATDLQQAGLKQDVIQVLSSKYALPILFDGMPVQEAIDFVAFILETTINAAKFAVGPPSCGAPIWIAVVTRDAGFKWIKRHEFQLT